MPARCVAVTPVSGAFGVRVPGMIGPLALRAGDSCRTSAEMLVTGSGHRLRPTVGRHLNPEPMRANCSDTGHAIAACFCLPINSIAVARRSGEQKFIVFATGECESNRRDADRSGIGSTGRRDRYPIKFHLCTDSTFFAQMPKISREAVGQ